MKILYVASFGGHWVQLQRIAKLIEADQAVFVSTNKSQNKIADYYVQDFSAINLFSGIRQLPKALNIVIDCRPNLIISTGAAPGLLLLFAGFILGYKTLWIDSIANTRRLSLSCRLAKVFATRVLTQNPNLATKRVHYIGRLL